jgi:hypothetical protein
MAEQQVVFWQLEPLLYDHHQWEGTPDDSDLNCSAKLQTGIWLPPD